ncbi:hypothetical protein [Streptomyces lavendofoliae]|uniref:Uncharacterized protein n=1 Tax=Streptomyces lavendofoliae TaxID=67314 RepID=A0A918I599_9ACTN|nr:hypothetical protein [Streptomyces lavendofoliae]GGU62696.1 hypothetical protein GCM10010274_59390 [Streptomyces lavendofoliae]
MSGTRSRAERMRVMVLWDGQGEWQEWGRFSKNIQRTYDEAAALAARPDVADVRIDRTTTITDQLTVAELHAQLLVTPASQIRQNAGSTHDRQEQQ